MATIVLVHGAWHGAWCWQKLSPILEEQGHKILTPDLPGHGADDLAPHQVSLKSYCDRICEVIHEQSEPVILIGHSMAGMVISQVAEQCSQCIQELGYICAFLPADGASLSAMIEHAPGGLPRSLMIVEEEKGHIRLLADEGAEFFYGQCTEQDRLSAVGRLCLQPAQPFNDIVCLTGEHFGSMPKTYFVCEADRVIPSNLQEFMAIQAQAEIRRLPSDHSPFLSMPDVLAQHIHQMAAR